MDAAARQIELKNRYIADHGKELYDKYYTGISHKTSFTKGTFDFFSNWRHTPRVSGESKAICSRVQQFEEMGRNTRSGVRFGQTLTL